MVIPSRLFLGASYGCMYLTPAEKFYAATFIRFFAAIEQPWRQAVLRHIVVRQPPIAIEQNGLNVDIDLGII